MGTRHLGKIPQTHHRRGDKTFGGSTWAVGCNCGSECSTPTSGSRSILLFERHLAACDCPLGADGAMHRNDRGPHPGYPVGTRTYLRSRGPSKTHCVPDAIFAEGRRRMLSMVRRTLFAVPVWERACNL